VSLKALWHRDKHNRIGPHTHLPAWPLSWQGYPQDRTDGMGYGLDAGRWHGTGCVTCSNLKFTGSLGTFETFGTSLPIKEGKNLKTMAGGRNKNRNLLNNLLCLYNKDLKSVFAGVGWVWDLDWVVGYCLGHRWLASSFASSTRGRHTTSFSNKTNTRRWRHT